MISVPSPMVTFRPIMCSPSWRFRGSAVVAPGGSRLTLRAMGLDARPDRLGGHPSETVAAGSRLNLQPRRGNEISGGALASPPGVYRALLPHQRTRSRRSGGVTT